MILREVNQNDYKEILKIYRYYIENTTVTFEYEVPCEEDFGQRIKEISSKYPYIVAEDNDRVVGYAYGDACFSTRMAYSWDSDISVYISKEYQGKGLGKRLYTALETLLKALGYVTLYAIVTGENKNSIAFHEGMGYTEVGDFPHSGYKMGKWLNVVFFTKRIGALDDPGDVPKNAPESGVYKLLKDL